MVFSNPLTQDRLNKLQEDAQELLKQFSLLFLKNYGSIVLENVTEELNGKSKNEHLKLKYRPSKHKGGNARREGLHKCECYATTGNGPGTFGDWKKVFVVEQDDHSVNIYADEKAYKADKKPTHVIRPAGYKAVSKVSEHYAQAMRDLARGLGLTEAEVKQKTSYSPYSWALAHPLRTNYIFQLHKPKSGSCSCLSRKGAVEPDDAGSERREDVLRNLIWMKTCVAVSNARCKDTEETARRAFRKTCEQLPEKIDGLKGWSDNGTETEILVDLLVEALLSPLRDQILSELTGPVFAKLSLWSTASGVITKTLTALVEPAWEAMQEEAKKLEPKVEQAVRPAVAKIIEIRAGIEEKIKAKSSKKLDSEVGSRVTPFIQPIINTFENPLKNGFELEREVLTAKLNLQHMPKEQEQLRDYLDHIARSADINKSVNQLTRELIAPVKALTTKSPETFEEVDIGELRYKAEEMLLQTMDAAAYTVSVQLDTKEPLTDEFLQEVIQKFDHDAVVRRCHFVNRVAEDVLIPLLKKLAAPVISEIVDALDSVIPDEMKEYLNIESILDAFIEKWGLAAIEKVVKAAYPLP